MAIIKITVLDTDTVGTYGNYNRVIKGEKQILFNTNEMISCSNNDDIIGSFLQYKRALVGHYYIKETIEEIEELINNAKN